VWVVAYFQYMPIVIHAARPYGLEQAARYALLFLFVLPLFYWLIAVMVKRLHDRNKSGLWFLFFWLLPQLLFLAGGFIGYRMMRMADSFEQAVIWMVSLMGAANLLFLWAFVELFCLQGTAGENRFGPDPLAGRSRPEPRPSA
jgi:uncharacterized membrane protein YhaH (DUF805 family)